MFERERESLRRQGKWAWFLVVPLLCCGSYCLFFAAAGLAIPAFSEFTQNASTQEASDNLATLGRSMEDWCEGGGTTGQRGFPPSAGPIPAEPRDTRQSFVALGSFIDLHFAPGLVYYSYSIDTPRTDASSLIAEGDLDGDGVRSRYVVTCRATVGACECDDLPTITDGLE